MERIIEIGKNVFTGLWENVKTSLLRAREDIRIGMINNKNYYFILSLSYISVLIINYYCDYVCVCAQ